MNFEEPHAGRLPRGLGRRGRQDRAAAWTRRPARRSPLRGRGPATGGWQNWTTVSAPITNPPQGTHVLYIVFTHPTDQGDLMNLNWFQVHGEDAAASRRRT